VIRRVYAVALNTFREAIRNKILHGVAVLVVAVNLGAVLLGAMSQHEEARIARDMGLSAMSFLGAVTAIILGVSLLYAEIQKRTIHVILAKPLERHEFVLGKYLGMAVTLTLLVALFAVSLLGILKLQDVAVGPNLAKAMLLAYLEVLLVAAIAVLFSSFSTPFLSGIFTFAIFILGRVTPEIQYAAARSDNPVIEGAARVALWIVPDLHLFAVSGTAASGQPVSVNSDLFVSWGYVGTSALYAAACIAVLLALSMIIFSRRDFA
jgi:ABC-type transport system involved in multi-copper enzyme maturation permease subunit